MLPSIVMPGFDVSISTYAIVRTVCIVAALLLTIRLNERQGVRVTVTLSLFAVGVPAAIVGAHLLDALEYWRPARSLGELLVGPGSSIYGAFFGGFAVGWAYLVSQRIPPLRVFDAAAPAMALGEAMTRMGCFLNGCCYGVPSMGAWAVTFPPSSFAFQDQVAHGLILPSASHSLAVHPVQLYSTAVMIGVTLYLLRKYLRPHREGEVFFTFLISYGVLRLLVAPLRVEALASMKVFSVAFIAVGGMGLLARHRAASTNRVASST